MVGGSRAFAYALVVLFGCSTPAGVSGQLQRALETDPNEPVRIADLTSFDWEAFVALGPYSTRQQAEAALGFSWPEFDNYGIDYSDSFSLLVFAHGGAVVHAEKHPRCKPDFDEESQAVAFPPTRAVFRLSTEEHCALARAAA